MSKARAAGVLAAGFLSLVPAGASAAPVTVDLRVEGRTRTLLERQVTTDVRTFRFTDAPATYPCDATGPTGSAATPSPTRGAALITAAEEAGVSITGTVGSFGPTFATIAGEAVGYDAATGEFLVEYENGVPAQFGSCNDAIATGDEVVFAYGTGSEPVLRLTAPATAAPGQPVTVRVTDAASGAGIAGATVGGATTGPDGTASVTLTQRGLASLKAAKAGTIRSNAARTCVTDGADGFCATGTAATPAAPQAPAASCATTGRDGLCGTPDLTAPRGRIASVREGARLRRGIRQLAGTVSADPSGIREVRLRLSRTDRGRCYRYDGRGRERFVRASRCGAGRALSFRVGSSADWSYLLPASLPRGRYVLDVFVTDARGNRTRSRDLQRGTSRVVFTVG